MTEDIREAARKRIKGRRDFWTMLFVFVVITILLNVIWLTSSSDAANRYYWPMWPMIGFAIATVFSAFSTFGPGSRPITEDRIDEEVRRMGGNPDRTA